MSFASRNPSTLLHMDFVSSRDPHRPTPGNVIVQQNRGGDVFFFLSAMW